MSRNQVPWSLVKKSSVPWLEQELGQVRAVHWTIASAPIEGSMVSEVQAGEAGAGHQQQGLLEFGEGHRLIGAGVGEGPGMSMPRPMRRLLRSKTNWKKG